MMDSVALVKYTSTPEKTLRHALELLGGLNDLKPILIVKPNICTGVDQTGLANTDPRLVEALIRTVAEHDKDVSIKIVESDSEAKYIDEAFRKFGYIELQERLRDSDIDVSLVNLSSSPTTKIRLDGLYFKDIEVPSLLVEEKSFISLAVAKTHALTFVTGTVKNLFGLLPRKGKSFYHPHINEVILDLNRLVRPDLCIVDAREGLEGWAGPRRRLVNMLVLGRNAVSTDAVMARVMGFNPENIRHLSEGEKHGLGTLNPTVLGEEIEPVAVKFNPPSRPARTA
jgi:uncharacterized protein (DUF362 family)